MQKQQAAAAAAERRREALAARRAAAERRRQALARQRAREAALARAHHGPHPVAGAPDPHRHPAPVIPATLSPGRREALAAAGSASAPSVANAVPGLPRPRPSVAGMPLPVHANAANVLPVGSDAKPGTPLDPRAVAMESLSDQLNAMYQAEQHAAPIPANPSPSISAARMTMKASQAAAVTPIAARAAGTIKLNDNDIYQISRVTQAEAAIDGASGMQAVASSVINRMKSGQFGVNPHHRVAGDIERLLNADNQFESVDTVGGLANLPQPGRDAINAVTDVASGRVADPTNGATFFQNRAITRLRHTSFGTSSTLTAEIKHHSFYDGYGGNRISVPDMQVAYEGRIYAEKMGAPAPKSDIAAATPAKPAKPTQVAGLLGMPSL
ncbi:MAG: cell wall hydrolase [Alphaproteobacteria bacterium]|nr:cell wall hydrolase [Alphaproteobacteria bacterium]